MAIVIKKQLELWGNCLSQEMKFSNDLVDLYNKWFNDLTLSKYGYPKNRVNTTPYIEETFLEKGGSNAFQKRPPAIFLTHDVDYLCPTLVMWLKKAVGRKQFSVACFKDDYLNSLEDYLKIDRSYIGDCSGHLFIASSIRPLKWHQILIHYLIDPSYQLSSKLGARLYNLINRYEASVGIHGSYFSLTDSGSFNTEKKMLESWTGCSIYFNRQHWLNISNFDELIKLFNAGIRFDSSLGWNGCLGVRGGFLRPYPICLGDDMVLWEIPMLLMDGVLFDELRLSEKEVIAKAINALEQVFNVGGCVALNWHERTRSKSYGWGDAYDKILEWCKKRGFLFYSSEGIIDRIRNYEGKCLFTAN